MKDINGVEVMEVRYSDGNIPVRIINVCTLMEHLWPGYFDSATFDLTYEEEGTAIMNWASTNNAHIYCRPREDFFLFEAVDETIAKGLRIVVVEDMS